jgi:hypothetical protein
VEIDGKPSILKEIPIGCVQGSILGPCLFNIYTSGLNDIIGDNFFKIAYAGDSYIAISCSPNNFPATKLKLEEKLREHFNWLKSLGMVANPLKTEYIVFHPASLKHIWNDPLLVDNCKVFPTKNLKILDISFSDTLDWDTHVDSVIRKANSMLYAFCCLNSKLSRLQFKSIICAHYISKLTYASQVWSGVLSSRLRNRLDSSKDKILRLLCRDYKARVSRPKLLDKSGMLSLRSMFVCRDAKLLHTLCYNLMPEPLAERLLSQCHFLTRLGDRPHFLITVPGRSVATALLTEQNIFQS